MNERFRLASALLGIVTCSLTGAASATAQSALPVEPGWSMSGGGRAAYAVQPDAEIVRDGRATLRLAPVPEPPKYGTWMRVIDAAEYRGERIRVSAFTRTEGACLRVDFWARVQARDSPGDGTGLGGVFIPLPSDQEWTRQEIVLEVPQGASSIQYGVGLAGPGQIWIDRPEIEIVGHGVPLSEGITRTSARRQ